MFVTAPTAGHGRHRESQASHAPRDELHHTGEIRVSDGTGPSHDKKLLSILTLLYSLYQSEHKKTGQSEHKQAIMENSSIDAKPTSPTSNITCVYVGKVLVKCLRTRVVVNFPWEFSFIGSCLFMDPSHMAITL